VIGLFAALFFEVSGLQNVNLRQTSRNRHSVTPENTKIRFFAHTPLGELTTLAQTPNRLGGELSLLAMSLFAEFRLGSAPRTPFATPNLTPSRAF